MPEPRIAVSTEGFKLEILTMKGSASGLGLALITASFAMVASGV